MNRVTLINRVFNKNNNVQFIVTTFTPSYKLSLFTGRRSLCDLLNTICSGS